MKEQWEQECADLRAELAALQEKLQALETKQADAKGNASPIFRRRLSQGAMMVVLPVVVLLAAGGALYGQGAMDALFIDKDGHVGIGTSTPSATLDVAGTLNVTQKATLAETEIKGTLTTEGHVGIGIKGQEANLDVSGKADADKQISLQVRSGNSSTNFNSNQITFGYDNTDTYRHAIKTRHHGGRQAGNAIDFYVWKYDKDKVDPTAIGGLHTMTFDGGNVGIGTTDPKAKLDVAGDARFQGKVSSYGRYQRDDQPEANYEISPPYHLSLTAPVYGGRTKTIPQNVIEDLCGDSDGCEFRLAMTRWSSDKDTESASRSGVFYYSKNDGHWRASSGERDAIGVDGDGATQHVMDAGDWHTCYFTDGTYSQYQNQGDKQKGMQLLVWNGYRNANRTCELTLID